MPNAAKAQVGMPASKLKAAIAQVLRDEGYITDFRDHADRAQQGGIDHYPRVLRGVGR